MSLSASEFEAFEKLVQTDGQKTELACSAYLDPATDFLLGQTPARTITIAKEKRNYFGRSDFMIVADIQMDNGAIERVIDIWELKAPQECLMEFDDAIGRYRPSKALIKAETQLLHYVDEAQKSGQLHETYELVYSKNVRPRGIIIGRDEFYLRNGDPEAVRHAKNSFRMRRDALYNPWNIRIVTWDRVLRALVPKKEQ